MESVYLWYAFVTHTYTFRMKSLQSAFSSINPMPQDSDWGEISFQTRSQDSNKKMRFDNCSILKLKSYNNANFMKA